MNHLGVLVPSALLLILIGIAFAKKGAASVGEGFSKSGALLLSVAPSLAVGFLLAGFVGLLVPQRVIAGWIGEDSGVKGLLVASVAGILTPGGPFTHFPLLAALRSHGAGIGPITAYISAWALLGIHRIVVWEGPLMGWRFVAARALACLVCPPVTGWLAQALMRLAGASSGPAAGM